MAHNAAASLGEAAIGPPVNRTSQIFSQAIISHCKEFADNYSLRLYGICHMHAKGWAWVFTSRRAGWLLALLLTFIPLAPALAQTGNPKHDALLARPDLERRHLLHQAVTSQAQRCSAVTLAFHAGMDRQRNAFWDFRCADGATYRSRLPPGRLAAVTFLPCGAAAPPPQGGPCFQTLDAAPIQVARRGGEETTCRAACTEHHAAGQNRCVARCLSGQGIAVGPQFATAPAGSRFGAMYLADNPLPAYGFANGGEDRLAINLRAIRACQAMAGPVPCRFQGELVNQCGAIALAISRSPHAMVMTSDISTQVLNLGTTGRGETHALANMAAMDACRRAEGPGVRCNIVAGGC